MVVYAWSAMDYPKMGEELRILRKGYSTAMTEFSGMEMGQLVLADIFGILGMVICAWYGADDLTLGQRDQLAMKHTQHCMRPSCALAIERPVPADFQKLRLWR